jgi:AraC-like DNA-binding protein
VQQRQTVRPGPGLSRLVSRIHSYRLTGFAPGVHVGMPSTTLTLVVSLDAPIMLASDGRAPRPFSAVVAGLHQRPVSIHHDGTQHGIQLALTPAGARALLGCPAGELAGEMVELSELLAPADRFLAEQAAGLRSAQDRIALVVAALTRRADSASTARPEIAHAWDAVCRSRGSVPVWAVANQVGWSARHLGTQFRAEYGLGVKTVARVARFDRSRELVASRNRGIADIAARCSYADQAHLTREWREFAGTAPSRWLREDELAFVQDDQRSDPAEWSS